MAHAVAVQLRSTGSTSSAAVHPPGIGCTCGTPIRSSRDSAPSAAVRTEIAADAGPTSPAWFPRTHTDWVRAATERANAGHNGSGGAAVGDNLVPKDGPRPRRRPPQPERRAGDGQDGGRARLAIGDGGQG
eukprot:scaffold2002_cov96-Isochrysis_galbana.AAC.4